MSLLNETLRALHQREALPVGAPTGMMAGVSVVEQSLIEPGKRFPWQRSLLLAAALSMIAAGYGLAVHLKSNGTVSPETLQVASALRRGAEKEPISVSARGSIASLEISPSSVVALRLGTSLSTPSSGGSEETLVPDVGESVAGDSQGNLTSPRVADVRVVQSSRHAVVEMELDQSVDFRVFTLAEPTRLVLDIPQVRESVPEATVEGRGPVDRVRIARETEDGLRMVLDLSQPVRIDHSSIEPSGELSQRLRVDLVFPGQEHSAATESKREPAPLAFSVRTPVQNAGNDVQHAASGSMEKKLVRVERAALAESHYREAMQLFANGRQREGEERLRKALAAEPAHAKAREALALRLGGQGAYRNVRLLLLEGLRLQPGNSRLNSLYARLLVERGEPEQALAVLSSVSPALAEDPEYYAFQAALLRKTGQYARAADLYRRLLEVRPQTGVWWMGLAISLEANDEAEEALQAYRKAAAQTDMTVTLNRFVKDRIQRLESQTS